MKKEFQGFEEDSEMDILQDSPRAKLKKVPNWKTSGHDGIYGFCFKNSRSFTTDWLSNCLNLKKKQA